MECIACCETLELSSAARQASAQPKDAKLDSVFGQELPHGIQKSIDEAGRLRRDYATLMAKSNRELSDIGLTRGDVIAGFEYGRWPTHRGYRG
jgi:hypothetical protein